MVQFAKFIVLECGIHLLDDLLIRSIAKKKPFQIRKEFANELPCKFESYGPKKGRKQPGWFRHP